MAILSTEAQTLPALTRRLFRPVDVASLAVFRIIFGVVMAWEATRYLRSGWIHRYWIDPEVHFWYPGFRWLQPLPEPLLVAHWVVLGLLGLCIAAGVAYRLSMALFTIGFTYIFLLDPTTYLNHLYLVCVMSGLMVFLPLHRSWSVDAILRKGFRREKVGAWALWSLRGLVALVYLYAGLAKLNPDWLRAQPMLIWMERRAELPVVGPLLAWDPMAWIMSYAGLLLDLVAGPALIWRRSRMVAVLLLGCFHLTNAFVFDIGIFPWLMLGASLLFLDPGWPRRLLRKPPLAADAPAALPGPAGRRLVILGLGLFFLVQALLPLRHLLYPGRPSWSEEGHRFAWHMKLRTKSGSVRFRVKDRQTGKVEIIGSDDLKEILGERQARKFKVDPDLIRQMAWHLRERAEAEGRDVEVFADSRIKLNGRPARPLVDPKVDLSRVEWSWGPADWIMPLKDPLPGWDW